MQLTFKQFQDACEIRHQEQLQKFGLDHGENWSVNDWIVAVTGELGELANIAKKVRRKDFPIEQVREELGKEWADIIAYMFYLAKKLEIDPATVVINKFDEIGVRLNLRWTIDQNGNIHDSWRH